MFNNLPLTIAGILVLSLAAIATVSAGHDGKPGPAAQDMGTPTETPELEDIDETPAAAEEPEDVEDDIEVQDAEGGEGEGAEKVAQAIADAFDVPVEEVLALHEDGMGFGAIYKLYQLAAATGQSVADVIAANEEDGGGFAFGKKFHDLSEEEAEALDEFPKNLGQAVSSSAKGHGGSDGE